MCMAKHVLERRYKEIALISFVQFSTRNWLEPMSRVYLMLLKLATNFIQRYHRCYWNWEYLLQNYYGKYHYIYRKSERIESGGDGVWNLCFSADFFFTLMDLDFIFIRCELYLEVRWHTLVQWTGPSTEFV